MNKFSKTSKARLDTCDQKIQDVLNLALQVSVIDFGIASGERTLKEQSELYALGRTKPGNIVTNVDGVNKKSMHNYKPSKAVDIYAWIGKASWDKAHLCYLAGVIMTCAKKLNVDLRWGGNWDGDGIIISDQNFQDLPHYELIN